MTVLCTRHRCQELSPDFCFLELCPAPPWKYPLTWHHGYSKAQSPLGPSWVCLPHPTPKGDPELRGTPLRDPTPARMIPPKNSDGNNEKCLHLCPQASGTEDMHSGYALTHPRNMPSIPGGGQCGPSPDCCPAEWA